MRTLAAEMIREKILHQTYEEVPYSVAVEIDEFVEEGKAGAHQRDGAGRARVS